MLFCLKPKLVVMCLSLFLILFTGCKLSEHQEPAGFDVSDSGRHDQGENTRGDPQDVQHQE